MLERADAALAETNRAADALIAEVWTSLGGGDLG
jgi:hypothetical protein